LSQVSEQDYEAVIAEAEDEAARGEYKDAYNTLGRALNIGGDADRECKYRRGVYALRVGHTRLDDFENGSGTDQTLIKAGSWLSRSEAYLTSAREGASEEELRQIERDLEEAKQEQGRFRELCRTSNVDIFLADDEGDNHG
jgi:hypothetical protein